MRKAGFWIVIAATLGVYLAMFVWTMPKLEAYARGLFPFDKRPFGYTAAEGKALLQALGAEGRDDYANAQHRLDLAYPGLMALALTLLFRSLSPGWPGVLLSVVALVAAIFDWGENAVVAQMLLAVTPTDAQLELASRLTVIKSSLVTFAMLALVLLLDRAGLRRWRGGNQA
jgi:hypothetical protein